MKIVKNVFLGIGALVGNAVKNTFLAFIMTPQGAYATGFVLGFLWKKLKSMFEKGGLLRAPFDFIKDVFDPFFTMVKNWFFVIYDHFIKPVVDILGPLIKPVANIVGAVLGFVFKHPKLVTSILAILQMVPPLM